MGFLKLVFIDIWATHLKYYDDLKLRQAIEKQLNLVELSHKFAKAIFFGNNQEFQVESKEEQEIIVNCRKLIQNAIVLWNYLYLTNLLNASTNNLEFDMEKIRRFNVRA
jgi:TnpA family transposase